MEGKFDYIERFKKLGYGIFVNSDCTACRAEGNGSARWIRNWT